MFGQCQSHNNADQIQKIVLFRLPVFKQTRLHKSKRCYFKFLLNNLFLNVKGKKYLQFCFLVRMNNFYPKGFESVCYFLNRTYQHLTIIRKIQGYYLQHQMLYLLSCLNSIKSQNSIMNYQDCTLNFYDTTLSYLHMVKVYSRKSTWLLKKITLPFLHCKTNKYSKNSEKLFLMKNKCYLSYI